MNKQIRDQKWSAYSLRWRLIRTISIVVILVWGMAGLLSYSNAQYEAEEMMDGNLEQNARLLLALSLIKEQNLPALTQWLDKQQHNNRTIYQAEREFQIADKNGNLLSRSAKAPEQLLTKHPGYANVISNGQTWRVFHLEDQETGFRVLVFQSGLVRDEAALEIATRTALPIGLILPVLLLLIYYSIRRNLKPVDQLCLEVSSRSAENLLELENRKAPLEIQAVIEALNLLFRRLSRSLENERRFTADAAHELRTPIAAIKIHSQIAAISKDPEQLRHALEQTQVGVNRATHVVEQLLRLARLDPLAHLSDAKLLNLSDLASATACEMESMTQRGLQVDTAGDEVLVSGDDDLLRLALRNLLENALRYSPPDGKITVYTKMNKAQIMLGVRDSGPGCAAADLPHLSQRFYRGSSANGEGSGLGLAIVSRIAEIHGATLALANHPEGGFDASILWDTAANT